MLHGGDETDTAILPNSCEVALMYMLLCLCLTLTLTLTLPHSLTHTHYTAENAMLALPFISLRVQAGKIGTYKRQCIIPTCFSLFKSKKKFLVNQNHYYQISPQVNQAESSKCIWQPQLLRPTWSSKLSLHLHLSTCLCLSRPFQVGLRLHTLDRSMEPLQSRLRPTTFHPPSQNRILLMFHPARNQPLPPPTPP